MPDVQELKRIGRRIIEEVIDGGDLDLADELIAEDYQEGQPMPGLPSGREGWKAWVRMIRQAFPDWRHTVEDIIAEGDKVVVRTTAKGTHRGEFLGIAPTGRTIEEPGIDIMRIVDGKMVQHWGQYDWFGLLRQLDAVPNPQERVAAQEKQGGPDPKREHRAA